MMNSLKFVYLAFKLEGRHWNLKMITELNKCKEAEQALEDQRRSFHWRRFLKPLLEFLGFPYQEPDTYACNTPMVNLVKEHFGTVNSPEAFDLAHLWNAGPPCLLALLFLSLFMTFGWLMKRRRGGSKKADIPSTPKGKKDSTGIDLNFLENFIFRPKVFLNAKQHLRLDLPDVVGNDYVQENENVMPQAIANEESQTVVRYGEMRIAAGVMSHPHYNASMIDWELVQNLGLENEMVLCDDCDIQGFLPDLTFNWQNIPVTATFFVSKESISPQMSLGLDLLRSHRIVRRYKTMKNRSVNGGSIFYTLPESIPMEDPVSTTSQEWGNSDDETQRSQEKDKSDDDTQRSQEKDKSDDGTLGSQETDKSECCEASFENQILTVRAEYRTTVKDIEQTEIAITGRSKNLVSQKFLWEGKVGLCCFCQFIPSEPKALDLKYDLYSAFARNLHCVEKMPEWCQGNNVSFALGREFMAEHQVMIDYANLLMYVKNQSNFLVPIKLMLRDMETMETAH